MAFPPTIFSRDFLERTRSEGGREERREGQQDLAKMVGAPRRESPLLTSSQMEYIERRKNRREG